MVCGAGVDLRKTVLELLEPRHIIKLRCLDQASKGVITPAMIFTAEHCEHTSLIPSDGICAMETNIVECADLAILSLDQGNGDPCEFIGLVSPRLTER